MQDAKKYSVTESNSCTNLTCNKGLLYIELIYADSKQSRNILTSDKRQPIENENDSQQKTNRNNNMLKLNMQAVKYMRMSEILFRLQENSTGTRFLQAAIMNEK